MLVMLVLSRGSSIAANSFALWTHAASTTAQHAPEFALVQNGTIDEGPRIGRFAGSAFASLGSTSQGIRAAKQQRLLLNGVIAKAHVRVCPGDTVTLLPAKGGSASGAQRQDKRAIHFAEGLLSTGALTVLHEDDEMAIVDKPAGIHTKPFGMPLALEHALPAVLTPPPSGACDALLRPTAVHRLDKRVQGLVVVAKTRSAAASLAASFRERQVRKRYRALLVGRLDVIECLETACSAATKAAGGLEVSAEADGAELRVTSLIDGRPAQTLVRVLEHTPHVQAGWLTTVDLQPLTGRRHQLRRHCQMLGFAICGDDLYPTVGGGEGSFGGKRSGGLFLQSIAVSVLHPRNDGSWVSAEIPEAAKFRRQRERSRLGWEFEQQCGCHCLQGRALDFTG